MENFNLLEKKENPLFNRKEIIANVEAEITPSRKEIKKLISEKLSVSSENIRIKNILGKFGSKIFTINANVYGSKQDKDRTEPKSKKDSDETESSSPKELAPQTDEKVESKLEKTDTQSNQSNEVSEDKSE